MSRFVIRLVGFILLGYSVQSAVNAAMGYLLYMQGNAETLRMSVAAVLAALPSMFLGLLFLFWAIKTADCTEEIDSPIMSVQQMRGLLRLLLLAMAFWYVIGGIAGLFGSIVKYSIISLDPQDDSIFRNFYHFIRLSSQDFNFFILDSVSLVSGVALFGLSRWAPSRFIK